MRLLVTGGCGFIGSHFIEYFLKTHPQAEVTNIDSLTYAAHPDTPDHLQGLAPARYRFSRLDIASSEAAKLVQEGGFDAIVNFAAETHVDRSIIDPSAFVRTNVLAVQNLLSAARMAKARFVHISTDEVYGSLNPTDPQFTEQSHLDPRSPYAASKASADLLVLASFHTHGQEVLITRCTNNYGPYQFPEKLFALLIANALEDLKIPVYGDGKQVRDWIYVEDHCRGIDAVLQLGKPGEVYNISASQERANLDLIHLVLDMLKKPKTLISHVGDRPGHDRRYGLESTKIRKELGWTPQYTFEAGLKKTIDWYVSHQGWWKKVRDKDFYKYYSANYDDKFGAAKGRVNV